MSFISDCVGASSVLGAVGPLEVATGAYKTAYRSKNDYIFKHHYCYNHGLVKYILYLETGYHP